MQRWQFPINNSTLKALSDQANDWNINVFVTLSCLFSIAVSLRSGLLVYKFCNGEAHRKKHFSSHKTEKRQYLPHLWSDLGFICTIVSVEVNISIYW